ncbi:MAG TPA: class IV lanthionine synthetase LanL [Pseudonocardiaceae bacterium]|jgi:serine/threonine protein kinase/rhamnogalacturonyl hydrolase YesR|nr:class IV lanthionine synthetase LanL [Pseudonocardiaceae bacterium]
MAPFDLSVFTSLGAVDVTGSVLVAALDQALRDSGRDDLWRVETAGMWCAVTPAGYSKRRQGWKLHVSATPASAEAVLRRSLPPLLDSGAAFKFVSTLDQVAALNDRHTARGHSGKVVTVYPNSDREAVRLADALHRATEGLAGPRILSDRPYTPTSLVHYRYGAFVEQRQLSDDGHYAWVIHDPNGDPVEDLRTGHYRQPDWVSCPFPTSGEHDNGTSKGKPVLVVGRFQVREAIRHSNRGGVYRATDMTTGADVVLKEVRPHVGADMSGQDERDRLRAEARALEHVAALDIAPTVVDVFEQGQHLFLAEELISGVPLRDWVGDRIRDGGWRRAVRDALPMASRVTELMRAAHRAGLVLRDFNPNNIMVRPDGEVRLIDLELAVPRGPRNPATTAAGTHGYGAPEQFAGAPPALEADYYSLGATLCFITLGCVPALLPDVPAKRALRVRLAEWLTARWQGCGLPSGLRTLIAALMDDDPAQRPTPAATSDVLATIRAGMRDPSGLARHIDRPGGRVGERQWRRGVDGIVDHLLDTMTPANPERLWPVSCAHGAPDPCTVQHGAAGVLAPLTRYLEAFGSKDCRLLSAVRTAGDWIIDRLQAGPQRPPGLYFGTAGIAWALYDTGLAIGERRFRHEALALAEALPTSVDSPDITHGAAGIGLTLLRLGHRSGNRELLRRAGECADALIAGVDVGPAGMSWPTPAEVRSKLAGRRYQGFAHGTAGVGYFLLATAQATGRSDCFDMARRAGDTLADTVLVDDGLALWSAGFDDTATAPHWCHGSAGVGAFLIRLHRVTGDARFGRLAAMAARAVAESAGRNALGQCHGVAGGGEFLLDLAELTGDPDYRSMAGRLARLTCTTRAYRDGRVVFPDERGGVTSTWGDGLAGVLSFLLRLHHQFPRPWMADELLTGRETRWPA